MLCEQTGFYVFLKWNFYLKIDFKIQTCLFTGHSLLPTGSVSFDTNEHVDAGACAVALTGASLLVKP